MSAPTSSRPLAVTLDAIGCCRDGAVDALVDITFALEPGSCTTIIGPNGSGKTTLLEVLSGALPATSGRRLLDGVPMEDKPDPRVGLVFQDPDDQLFTSSVLEDVLFAPRNFGLAEEEALLRARAALGSVGLEHLADRAPHALSGGEKRLSALASVLAMRPGVLALDEPTSDLDHRARRRVITLLAARGETRIIATHDLELVLDLGARVLILDGGRLVADGAAATLLADAALLETHGLEVPWSLRVAHRHSVMPDDPHHHDHHHQSIPHTHK